MADPHTTERSPDTAASSQVGVDFEAMDITIPPEHVSSYHEPGRFCDFNDPPEVVAEELEEFDSDSDTLTDADPHSDAEGDNGNTANIADPKPKNLDSSEPEATAAQSDESTVPPMPNASATRNSPSSLLSLLNSPHAPGRGSFDIKCNLAAEEEEVKSLKAEKRRLEILLKEAEQRCRKTHTRLEDSEKAFQVLQDQNGISEELWEEYEAFCESLEPEFGSRGGWSISCWTDHADSYLKYDPDLRLLSQFAEMPLQNCNFRCEAYTLGPKAKHQPDGNPPEKEWVVEFWPIASPELRTGTETTWGDQYPDLYRLATRALYDLTRSDTQAASELLRSLPDPKASCSGGWLFEYKREAKRAGHPVKSRRWTYRSARKIESLGESPYEPEEDPVTDNDAVDDLESDSEGAPTDEETLSTREEKDKVILDIFPTGNNFGMGEIDMGMASD